MQYMRSVTLYLITHYQLGLPWSAPDICLYRPWLALGLHFCLFLTCLFITDSSLNSDYVSAYVIVLDLIASYQPGLTDFTLCLSFCPTGHLQPAVFQSHSCLHTCSDHSLCDGLPPACCSCDCPSLLQHMALPPCVQSPVHYLRWRSYSVLIDSDLPVHMYQLLAITARHLTTFCPCSTCSL